MITGYVPLTMWRHSVSRSVKAFESNGSLLFHRQVTPFDILLARVFLEVTGTIMAGFLVAICAIVMGFMDPPVDIGLVYLGLMYHVGFCFGFALLVASLSEVSELVDKGLSILMYLSLPLSGAFTMVNWLPPAFGRVILWSPSVHNIEMIRAGQFGPGVHAHYDLYYDTWITALMLLVGISMTLRVRKHIIVQ